MAWVIIRKDLLEFLESLDYLSRGEIKDFQGGTTDLEVLLTIDDFEKYEEIKLNKKGT